MSGAKSLDHIAFDRASRALWRALRKSDHFDSGGMISDEVVGVVEAELRSEFLGAKK